MRPAYRGLATITHRFTVTYAHRDRPTVAPSSPKHFARSFQSCLENLKLFTIVNAYMHDLKLKDFDRRIRAHKEFAPALERGPSLRSLNRP